MSKAINELLNSSSKLLEGYELNESFHPVYTNLKKVTGLTNGGLKNNEWQTKYWGATPGVIRNSAGYSSYGQNDFKPIYKILDSYKTWYEYADLKKTDYTGDDLYNFLTNDKDRAGLIIRDTNSRVQIYVFADDDGAWKITYHYGDIRDKEGNRLPEYYEIEEYKGGLNDLKKVCNSVMTHYTAESLIEELTEEVNRIPNTTWKEAEKYFGEDLITIELLGPNHIGIVYHDERLIDEESDEQETEYTIDDEGHIYNMNNKRLVNEDYDDDDDIEYDTFADYANSKLRYECRCKEDWMEPLEAGTARMNNGECDIMWVCQGDCNFDDFETLMDCFGEFYKEETDGKTYVVVMKCRSWPGYGNYIKRTVSFEGGEAQILEEEDQVICYGKLYLYITEDNQFRLYCDDDDIEAWGNTIEEVKDDFERELDDLKDYVDVDPGYEVSYSEVELEDKFTDNMTVEDYLNSINKEEFDPKEPIGEGEYRTYESAEW